MKTIRHAWIASFALLVTPALHAQQPPNPTNSDVYRNTAGGTGALLNLVTPAGDANTAFGYNAMRDTDTGILNTAFGAWAMFQNTTGIGNTGVGHSALAYNDAGEHNTAVGGFSQHIGALYGNRNTSVGYASLFTTGGDDNVAVGVSALHQNSTGDENVAVGSAALGNSSTGNRNVGVGHGALATATTAANNIAIGHEAGSNLTTGSYNIEIGHIGEVGESKTIRIGVPGTTLTSQNRAFIAGIYGVTIASGSAVLIDGKGQLGTIVSSGRFKKDVADMGDASSALLKLRPVTFHYKADTTQAKQYGLIAEEVAKVYPDLVVRNERGEIDSVQYHQLAPMLLNELQKQRGEIDALRQERAHDVAQIKEMRALVQEQTAALTMLQTRIDETSQVASR